MQHLASKYDTIDVYCMNGWRDAIPLAYDTALASYR
jgi:hypothetical protein